MTNPQLEVVDVRAFDGDGSPTWYSCHCRSTIIPFTQFSAKDLGVDVEVISSTKYISGGATSLGGLIIDYGRFPFIGKRLLNEMLFNLGSYMTPQVAYMQTLGLETVRCSLSCTSC